MSDWKSRSKVLDSAGTNNWLARSKSVSDNAILNDYADKLNPVQEMPDWLNTDDRHIANNYSNSPADVIKLYQSKYPDKQFTTNANGDVLARASANEPWKNTRPDTWGDLGHKVQDNEYNIGMAIPQSIAIAGGAALGAFGGPAGMTATGALAGGYAAKGTEYLRQKLGQRYGMNQQLDTDKMNTAENAGAVGTLLFGAGAEAPGLASYGYNVAKNVGRGSAALASGIDSDILKHYGQNISKIDGITSETPLAQKIGERATSWGDQKVHDAGTALAQAMTEANEPVSLVGAKGIYKDSIANLEQRNLPDAGKADVEKLKAQLLKYLGRDGKELPDSVNANDAWTYQQYLKNPAKFDREVTTAESSNAKRAYGKINEALNASTDGVTGELKGKYQQAIDTQAILDSKFGGNATNSVDQAQAVLNNVRGLDKNSRRALDEKLRSLDAQGLGIADDVKDLQTYQAFNGPPSDRKTPLAVLLGSLGTLAGYKAGGGYAGAAAGGMTGGVIGAKLADPKVIQAAIRAVGNAENGILTAGTLGGRVPAEIPFYLAPNMITTKTTPSVWDRMHPKPVEGQ